MNFNENSHNLDIKKRRGKNIKSEHNGCYTEPEPDCCCCNPHQERECECVVNCNQTCNCECNCDGGGNGGATPALCVATGVIDQGNGGALVEIPPNACITKIYSSFRPGTGENTFVEVLATPNGTNVPSIFFQTYFETSPNHGIFETTLVQPLCVGPDGATVRADAEISTTIVSINVIYCPECCAQPE